MVSRTWQKNPCFSLQPTTFSLAPVHPDTISRLIILLDYLTKWSVVRANPAVVLSDRLQDEEGR